MVEDCLKDVSIMIMLFGQQNATEAYVRRQREAGYAEGTEEGAVLMLSSFVGQGLLRKEEAAKQAGLTVSEFKEDIQKLI